MVGAKLKSRKHSAKLGPAEFRWLKKNDQQVKKPRYGTPESVKAYYVGAQPATNGRILKGKEFEKRKQELEAQQQQQKPKSKPNF